MSERVMSGKLASWPSEVEPLTRVCGATNRGGIGLAPEEGEYGCPRRSAGPVVSLSGPGIASFGQLIECLSSGWHVFCFCPA
jgi:hypothetical protein